MFYSGVTDVENILEGISKNTPNPFSDNTTILFQLKQPAKVVLDIYNINGGKIRTLADSNLSAGKFTFIWNTKDEKGNHSPAGIYV
ncbi:MAG: hypothetical protein H0W62_02005 [Chitinophagales bacterium]|nr:hypothetical protein [Chitinophagales bacterium]